MRQCSSCGGCCGGGYVQGRKYIPCKSTATPVSWDAQISERDARIAELENENAALKDAIEQYMQTTNQRGSRKILIENFINSYKQT